MFTKWSTSLFILVLFLEYDLSMLLYAYNSITFD